MIVNPISLSSLDTGGVQVVKWYSEFQDNLYLQNKFCYEPSFICTCDLMGTYDLDYLGYDYQGL